MTETFSLKFPRPTGAFFAYLLIFSSAFGCYSTGFGDVGMTPINLVTFCLIPVVLISVMKNGKIPNLTPLGNLNLLFFFISLTGVLFARSPYGALHGSGGYLMDYFLCFFFVLYFIRTREEVENAVRLFIFLGIISSIMGTIELTSFFFFGKAIAPPFVDLFARGTLPKNYGYGPGLYGIPGFVQMYGFFPPTSAAFGSYMLIPFGLSLYKTVTAKTKKWPWHLLTLTFGIVVLLSMARNALVGLLALATFVFLFCRTAKIIFFPYPIVRRTFLLSLFGLALMLPLYFTRNSLWYDKAEAKINSQITIGTPVYILRRMNLFIPKSIGGSIVYFLEHASLATEFGANNFGFGLGAQNFDDYVYENRNAHWGSHSNYILFLGETGVWGLLTQIGIVILTAYYGLNTYYSRSLDRIDHLPLFLTAIYLGFVITGIVRTFYLTPHTFIIMGLITRLYTLRHPLPDPGSTSSPRRLASREREVRLDFA